MPVARCFYPAKSASPSNNKPFRLRAFYCTAKRNDLQSFALIIAQEDNSACLLPAPTPEPDDQLPIHDQ
jgi:hypothetical protein